MNRGPDGPPTGSGAPEGQLQQQMPKAGELEGPMGPQQFRPPLPVGPRPVLQQGLPQQQQGNIQLQPGMDNRMRLLLQQRQAEGLGAGMENTTAQSPLLAQQLAGRPTQGQGGGQGAMPGQPPAASEAAGDLLDGDIDANLGMNDDDLLGDFGDDFNILEFADALDGNDTKTNILDDLEAEETKEGEKDDAKPPPYPPPQGPPPPYPGPHKEQPLLIQDLLDQEKREQQQQQPNVMGAQQQPPQPQQQQ